jgi:glycolate oxidase FAD binding subunit
VLWRVSVPPSAGPQVVAALERAFEPAWLADWSGGLLWVALPELDDGGAAAIRSAIAGHGGHGTLVRAGAGLRTRLDVFQPQPEPLAALTARIAHSFDPQGILNPGRMVRRPAPSSA